MVNEHYEPDATEDTVIAVCRRENRVNAPLIVAETDLDRSAVNHALRDLATAGWIRNVARGLYEYVEDPRVEENGEQPVRGDTSPESGVVSRAHEVLDAWEPAEANTERGRAAAKRVVSWLAAQDTPQRKSDVVAWAESHSDQLGFSASTLWGKVAQPALGELRERGLATWTANVGWEIVEKV